MGNILLFVGGLVILFFAVMLLYWLVDEACKRVDGIVKLTVTLPVVVGFLLAVPLVVVGFGFNSFIPLFVGFGIVTVASIIIVLTKKEKKYPGFF